MKYIYSAIAIIFLASCQKDLLPDETSSQSLTVSSDAVAPLPCNTTAFSSNYAAVAGQVPPFKFSKTLYSSGRVKTINMLSRVFPIHTVYKKYAYELIGTFTYFTTNAVRFVGTRETWEYYKTSATTGSRQSLAKTPVKYLFKFNESGYCYSIINEASNKEVLNITYDDGLNGGVRNAVTFIFVGEDATAEEGGKFYYPSNDQYGNNISYDLPYNRWSSRITYTYDYTIPRGSKKYSFIPTQNLISQEYSLLEVMQWLPQPSHQRKTVSGIFYPYKKSTYPFNTGQKVVQSQTYKNYKFDVKGNQTSLTYADNVLQKTTWICK
jgi:hypothetical protein